MILAKQCEIDRKKSDNKNNTFIAGAGAVNSNQEGGCSYQELFWTMNQIGIDPTEHLMHEPHRGSSQNLPRLILRQLRNHFQKQPSRWRCEQSPAKQHAMLHTHQLPPESPRRNS